jgi:hypothetical protein
MFFNYYNITIKIFNIEKKLQMFKLLYNKFCDYNHYNNYFNYTIIFPKTLFIFKVINYILKIITFN